MTFETEIYTRAWWFALSTVGIINTTIALRVFFFAKPKFPTSNSLSIRVCSLIYAVCCAFRSILPRLDVERVCMYEHWLSYITIGRSVATIAEISFAYQLSCVLSDLAGSLHAVKKNYTTKDDLILLYIERIISKIQFWMLVVANGFCWSSVISTNQIYHAVEESLWMSSAVLLLSCYVIVWIKSNSLITTIRENKSGKKLSAQESKKFTLSPSLRYLFLSMFIFCPIYIVFMIYVDIPMYYNRWFFDTQNQKEYLSLIDGVLDSFQCKQITKSFDFWGKEMPWMSGYFSFAVWFSIFLMRSPSFCYLLDIKPKSK